MKILRTTPRSRDRSDDVTIVLMSKTRRVVRARRLKPNHRLLSKPPLPLRMAKVRKRTLGGVRDVKGVLPRSLKMEFQPKRSVWRRTRSKPNRSSLSLKKKTSPVKLIKPRLPAEGIAASSVTKKLH